MKFLFNTIPGCVFDSECCETLKCSWYQFKCACKETGVCVMDWFTQMMLEEEKILSVTNDEFNKSMIN